MKQQCSVRMADAAGRVFEVGSVLLLLLLLLPLLIVLALAVRGVLGSPILFRQRRTGLGGREFTLYKFRTMTEARDREGRLLPDEVRLTRFGRWLRAMSLDELPELWNVLKGDMRLVGPRPLLPAYLPRYSPEQMRRHEVKPGVTGWAQVHGRNALSWEEKFALDVWYVDHRSWWLDLKILGRTIWYVLRREGISQPGCVTAPEFEGTSPELVFAGSDPAEASGGSATKSAAAH